MNSPSFEHTTPEIYLMSLSNKLHSKRTCCLKMVFLGCLFLHLRDAIVDDGDDVSASDDAVDGQRDGRIDRRQRRW